VIHVFIVLLSLVTASVGTSIWAIVDAASRPQEDFVAIGSSKSTWIALIAVFTLFSGIVGFILALTYLFSLRPKMNKRSKGVWSAPRPVTSRQTWVSFFAWMLVGASFVMVIVGAFTIGIFFLPVAVIATIWLVRRPSSKRGLPGLFGGLGLPLIVVAYFNSGGPGMVCTQTQNVYGTVHSCTQEWSPWPWLMAGVLLFIVGVVVFMVSSRSNSERQCTNCAQSLGPEAKFCGHCGTQSEEFSEAL
jgi:hypothetical protein